MIQRRIEEITLNSWPALYTMAYKGWLLRFAEGYTKRANSVCVLNSSDSDELDGRIRYCEAAYDAAGQSTIFKLTSFGGQEQLDERLGELGYEKVDLSSVMVRELSVVKEPVIQSVEVMERLSDEWLNSFAALSGLSEVNKPVAKRMLELGHGNKGYFTLRMDGEPIGAGIGMIEDGYVILYDIVVHPDSRNRGYAEQLILHILQWAVRNGAERSCLQVVLNNRPAMRLYAKLGYEEKYKYWYRVKKV